MDKYLQEMLLDMNMIIIPGLGALSMVNRATGEIMFMPYLKHNDHVLAKHIAAKEGWEENDAANLIAKYVREIEAKLNVGESYDMYRFGSFKKDSSGDVNFESWMGESSANEDVSIAPIEEVTVVESKESVEEKIVLEPVAEKEVEPIIEPTEEVIPEPVILREESAVVIMEEEEQRVLAVESDTIEAVEPVHILVEAEKPAPEIIPVVIPEIEKEPIVEKVEEKTVQYTEEDQWKDDLDLPPITAKIERPKKPIIEKAKSDKKKRKPAFYILTFLLVILIGGSVTVGVFYNQLKEHLPFVAQETSKETSKEIEKPSDKAANNVVEEEKEDAEPIVEEEPIIEEESPVAEVPTEATNDSETIQTSTGSVNPAQPFHVIAGAFSDKSNADRFMDRLRESGNTNSEIIGKFDGLFIVSASSHQSMEEAQLARKRNSTISQSWIFNWP